MNYRQMKKAIEKIDRWDDLDPDTREQEIQREAAAFEEIKMALLKRVGEWMDEQKGEYPLDEGFPCAKLELEFTRDGGLPIVMFTETKGPEFVG